MPLDICNEIYDNFFYFIQNVNLMYQKLRSDVLQYLNVSISMINKKNGILKAEL